MDLPGQGNRALRADGYAMAALLVGLSVMSVLMSMALPVWSHMAKREKEEELIWRGQQYARAIGLFQRKYANTFPPTLDVLVEQRFLRKKYKDPITDDDFQLIPAGAGQAMPGIVGGRGGSPQPGMINPQGGSPGGGGVPPQGSFTQPGASGGSPTTPVQGGNVNLGISGVVSKSKDTSIKIYNGRQKYNEWAFVYLQTAQAINPGAGMPGMPGMPGGRGVRGGVGAPGAFPGSQQGQPMPGGFNPFAPGSSSGPGGSRMPPPPPSREFQPVNPPTPFGVPSRPPVVQPGQPMQPFGVPQRPPGR